MTIIPLNRGRWGELLVEPRWPAVKVLIDAKALSALARSQASLPNDTQLIITRAFEAPGSTLVRFRNTFRCVGKYIFWFLYPSRRSEIGDIFYHNGHEDDGTHVDITIMKSGRRLNFLTFGVLTPLFLIDDSENPDTMQIDQVKSILRENNFIVHRNVIESLQIHCDFRKNHMRTEAE